VRRRFSRGQGRVLDRLMRWPDLLWEGQAWQPRRHFRATRTS
jgi:hypothetical protein